MFKSFIKTGSSFKLVAEDTKFSAISPSIITGKTKA